MLEALPENNNRVSVSLDLSVTEKELQIKKELLKLIEKDKIDMIAIGNGTASRESEMFVADMIKEVKHDIHYAFVPMGKLANELVTNKVTNIVSLGAFINVFPIVKKESIISIMKEKLTGKKAQMLDTNILALQEGIEAVKNFCLCNAFKYLYRHDKKNGLEDIKKANWYINKYIELSQSTE